MVQLSHLCLTTGKTIALITRTLGSKVMSLLFNMLSRFVITFLPRSKRLLISWLQSPSVVIWEPQKIKSVTISTFSWSICHDVMEPNAMTLVFEYWILSQLFHSLSLSSRGLLPLERYHLHIWGCWCFSWQSWFQFVITLKKNKQTHNTVAYIILPIQPAFLMMYSAYLLDSFKVCDSVYFYGRNDLTKIVLLCKNQKVLD